MRSNYCGELSKKHINKIVTVCGWVHRRRDHGGVIFLDVRDKTGIVQVVVNPENKKPFSLAEKIRSEFVLKISGKVNERPEDAENEDLTTGVIEIIADEIIVLNEAETPAFPLDQSAEVSEEVRLKNRTLDLRRPEMQKNLETKSKISQIVRKELEKKDFIDIETPILTKATPEGARDYLVPSRIHQGKFYALPQAPQQFKQLLMIAGFDKYFQIAPCFRDEDSRADRSPGEFYQLDFEMSFVTQEDVFEAIEPVLFEIFNENKKNKTIEDYFVGGKRLGPVITSISYSASNSSAWTLLGVSGIAFSEGISTLWLVIGVVGGMFTSWLKVAPSIYDITKKKNFITIPQLISDGFKETERKNILTAASFIIIFSFTFFSSLSFVTPPCL